MKSHGTLRDGLRCSAAKAFLWPLANRTNLHLSLESMVLKVLMSGGGPGTAGAATGVEFSKRGKLHRVTARREVVLAAGAVQSPQLLMVSGLGPAAHLQQVSE